MEQKGQWLHGGAPAVPHKHPTIEATDVATKLSRCEEGLDDDALRVLHRCFHFFWGGEPAAS